MKRTEITVSPRHPLVRGLTPLLKKTVALLGIHACEWHIEVVSDTQMKQLHQQHLNDPTTTDVLTFDLREDLKNTREGSSVVLDTVVCADEAKRRGRELGHTPAHELLLYCIHSLLHVQGYDDRTKSGAARMHAREDALLEALGIGAVYSGSRSKPTASPRRNRKRAAR
jgi:probable rRNA maturation factor